MSLGLKAAYGSGSVADGVMQGVLANFLFFYLTIVCGLSNSLAGLSLFLALIVDSLVDPLVGSISDNSRSRIGRRHPFIFGGAVPLAAALGLLFSVPAKMAGSSLFFEVTFVSILLRISHSIFFLPYVALGAELSDDYTERTNIVASRFLFTTAGTGAALILGYGIFLRGGNQFHRDAYVPFGWACGMVVIAAAQFCAISTLRTLPRLHRVAQSPGSVATRFLRDMGAVCRHRTFVLLFLMFLVINIGGGTAAALYLHAATFFWKLPSWAIAAVAYCAPVGVLMSVPVSVFLSKRFEKRSIVNACFIALIGYYATVPVLRIVGCLPENGPALYAILIVLALMLGTVTGCAGMGIQSMMADVADEHELIFGTRREGLYYAGINFSAKAATGMGALVAGGLLSLIRFPTNLSAHGGADARIPVGIVRDLGLIYGPVVAAMFLIGTLIFVSYRLDRKRCAEIQDLLDARRQTTASDDTRSAAAS